MLQQVMAITQDECEDRTTEFTSTEFFLFIFDLFDLLFEMFLLDLILLCLILDHQLRLLLSIKSD